MSGVLVLAAPGDPVLTLLQGKGNNSSLGNLGKGFRAALSFTGFWGCFTCWIANRCVLEHGGRWILEGCWSEMV